MAPEHSPREASTAVADMQPRARAFMHAHPGDPFVGWRYITWIRRQWREWAAESGVVYGDKPMTDEHHDAFDAWLARRFPDPAAPDDASSRVTPAPGAANPDNETTAAPAATGRRS